MSFARDSKDPYYKVKYDYNEFIDIRSVEVKLEEKRQAFIGSLRENFKYLEFASSPQGGSAGYASYITSYLAELANMKRKNPDEFNGFLKENPGYNALCNKFPDLIDRHGIQKKMAARDQGVQGVLAQVAIALHQSRKGSV